MTKFHGKYSLGRGANFFISCNIVLSGRIPCSGWPINRFCSPRRGLGRVYLGYFSIISIMQMA